MDVDDGTFKRLFGGIVTLQDKDGNVLTFAGNSFLMSVVMTMGLDAATLSNRGCVATERLVMLYGDDRVAGIYKASQLPPDLMEEYNKKGNIFYSSLKTDKGFDRFKYDYKNCVGSVDFFYIPISLVYSPSVLSPRHANGLLISKSKGTYFRIEPQYSPDMDTTKIDEGIKKLTNEIGAVDFTSVNLNTVCPQSLTDDTECQFWTAYLTLEIIRNIYKKSDPNETIRDITSRARQSPEKLKEIIDNFKKELSKAVVSALEKSNMTWVEYERAKAKRQTAGMYWPLKYYRGLTRKQNTQRKKSATRRTKMSFRDPKAYVAFKSDKGIKTRKSSYTERFHKKYPDAKTLPEIAKATGISKSILQQVYDRGMAAWRTGHRPGASQQAWGMARVHSFVMKGKTWRTADKDLAEKV